MTHGTGTDGPSMTRGTGVWESSSTHGSTTRGTGGLHIRGIRTTADGTGDGAPGSDGTVRDTYTEDTGAMYTSGTGARPPCAALSHHPTRGTPTAQA